MAYSNTHLSTHTHTESIFHLLTIKLQTQVSEDSQSSGSWQFNAL